MTPDEIALYGPPLYKSSRCATTNTHQQCTQCKQWKKYLEFSKNKNRNPAIIHKCKKCVSEKNKEKCRKNYEKIESLYGPLIPGSRGKITKTHKFCPNCKQWKTHNCFNKHRGLILELNCWCKECVTIKDRERKYKISLDTYRYLLDKQNGQCAVCGASEGSNKSKNLYVDHDHDTGKIRGLLCQHCNFMLGYSKDTPDILRQGATYLERTCK